MILSGRKPILFLLFNFFAILQLANLLSQNYIMLKTPAQNLIESLPQQDRGYFVVYHLSKALFIVDAQNLHKPKSHGRTKPLKTKIPEKKYKSFEKMSTYPQLSSDMLNWTKETFNATDQDIRSLIVTHSAVCPVFSCFDPNDIGQMCCPF